MEIVEEEIAAEIAAEIVVEIEVKAIVEPGYYTILYNGPLQRQSRGSQRSILFGSTILFTGVSSSPISTVLYQVVTNASVTNKHKKIPTSQFVLCR